MYLTTLISRIRVNLLIGSFLLPLVAAHAQNGLYVIDSLNVRHGGPGPSYGFYFASCWGYVAPDGHEYALLGTYTGVSIIDLDAVPIREVAFIPGASSEWKEMKTWGHYAYAVADVFGSQGLQVIDLSQLPDSARFVKTITHVDGKNVTNNHTITVSDGYLYLNGTTAVIPKGTLILSLADPENPAVVGQYNPAYLHDTFVRNDILYGAGLGNGVYIASLANKSAPQTIGRITYFSSGTHNTWASVDGRYLFTSDEVGSTAKNMKVWDIQNLPAVDTLPAFTASPTTVIHNVHGRGNYVYIAHYKAGVFVADVNNPESISNVGSYNTYRGGGAHPNFDGCWGVYPYFPSGRIIASDTQTGLYVFRFNGLQPRVRPRLIAPANGGAVHGLAEFRWRKAASQTEDPHFYMLHILGPGVDTLLRASDTSLSVNALPGYQGGLTYRWHVWVRDEFTSVSSQDTFQFVYQATPTGFSPSPLIPERYSLEQNFPNPFNPRTTIRFELPRAEDVTLEVYNVLGEIVATIVENHFQAGRHEVEFAPPVDLGNGIYFYRIISSGGFRSVRKMVLLK